MRNDLEMYLQPGKYIDSDSPIVVEKAKELTKGLLNDVDKSIKIYLYVRDLSFDIVGGFRMLLEGKDKASDCIREGRGFCAQKAMACTALCRASKIPARIAFQIVECLDKPFYPEKIRKAYGTRPQPWHSSSEVYLHGKWIMADCTVDKEQGLKCGRTMIDFDGRTSVYTVEGPILKERGSSADFPEPILNRHRNTARSFIDAVDGIGEVVMTPQNILDGDTENLELIPPGE